MADWAAIKRRQRAHANNDHIYCDSTQCDEARLAEMSYEDLCYWAELLRLMPDFGLDPKDFESVAKAGVEDSFTPDYDSLCTRLDNEHVEPGIVATLRAKMHLRAYTTSDVPLPKPKREKSSQPIPVPTYANLNGAGYGSDIY